MSNILAPVYNESIKKEANCSSKCEILSLENILMIEFLQEGWRQFHYCLTLGYEKILQGCTCGINWFSVVSSIYIGVSVFYSQNDQDFQKRKVYNNGQPHCLESCCLLLESYVFHAPTSFFFL